GPSETTLEDAGPQFFSPWASGISAGPANESAQHVTFTITNNSNSTLFSAGPSVTPSGALSYTSAPNAYGSATLTVVAQDDGGTANGGVDTSAAQTFTINVTAVNDPPSFTKGADQTSLEDAGPQTVAGWATAIDAGPNESGQTVTFTATNDDNALFLTQPAVASNGTLTYTAAANANGVATVTVVAHDDGGIANGGVDTSAPQTFTITIVSVNDAPSFTKGADQNIVEDAGAETVVHWATSISAGPADESSQSVSFTTSNDNNGLFSVQPSVDASGTLTYTPASDANGSATVTVIAHDDGGTANGGVDTSAPQTFAINVASVNDAPSFTKGPDVSLLSDAGPQTYVNWATNISPGPANESAQLVSFLVNNDNNAVFTSQPAVSSGGTLTFTTAVAAPTTTVHVSVSAHDNGGTANGGIDTSAPQTFAINVTHVNQPPAANNDSFDAIGNTELAVGAPGTQPASLAATGSVLANDSDPDSDPLTATLGTVTAGASVTMNPNGTFTYLPPVGFTGDDTFTYVLSDGQGHNVPATVTIHVTKRVLYVKNNGGGSTGRVDSPYATLAAAQAGAATNDTVYIFTGDGTTTGQNAGFTLNHDGERLIGEGVALTVSGTYNGTSNPQLRGAGTRPQISNGAGEAVKVAAASGVISNTEVSGIEITSSALHGVNITNAAAVVMDGDHIASTTNSGVRGTTVSGFSFTNGTIATSGSVAGDGNISFDNLTGSATISNSTFSGAFSDNIRVANTTGSLDRLTLTNVTMNGNNATTGNNAVQLSVGTGATLNVTVTGSHFNSTRAQHFQLSLTGSATSDVVFTGNSISNAQAALSGGGGVVVATGGGGNPALTYNISNNTIRDAVGAALNVTKGSGAGVATGTISDNTIGIASVTDSGSAQGSGILVAHIGGGASTTTVTNNHVAQYNGTGITVQIGDASSGGTGSINAHVTGNAISNPGAFASNGFLLNAGTVSGDQHSVCLTLGGSGSAANSLTGTGANGSTDIRLRQRQATTVSLAGYVGANNDNTAVQTYVQSQNGGTPTVSAANTVPTGGGFTGGTCP
ncbi:MAG TPA: Ig-like domain-containing protein, partial [Vicinamibacterales bacterium]|nr:Ig-like domain-containing protein [Vicinamibacterales bacterium]